MAAVREAARAALDEALASLPFEAADELLEGDVVDELAALDDRVRPAGLRIARLRAGPARAARGRGPEVDPPGRVPGHGRAARRTRD